MFSAWTLLARHLNNDNALRDVNILVVNGNLICLFFYEKNYCCECVLHGCHIWEVIYLNKNKCYILKFKLITAYSLLYILNYRCSCNNNKHLKSLNWYVAGGGACLVVCFETVFMQLFRHVILMLLLFSYTKGYFPYGFIVLWFFKSYFHEVYIVLNNELSSMECNSHYFTRSFNFKKKKKKYYNWKNNISILMGRFSLVHIICCFCVICESLPYPLHFLYTYIHHIQLHERFARMHIYIYITGIYLVKVVNVHCSPVWRVFFLCKYSYTV